MMVCFWEQGVQLKFAKTWRDEQGKWHEDWTQLQVDSTLFAVEEGGVLHEFKTLPDAAHALTPALHKKIGRAWRVSAREIRVEFETGFVVVLWHDLGPYECLSIYDDTRQWDL